MEKTNKYPINIHKERYSYATVRKDLSEPKIGDWFFIHGEGPIIFSVKDTKALDYVKSVYCEKIIASTRPLRYSDSGIRLAKFERNFLDSLKDFENPSFTVNVEDGLITINSNNTISITTQESEMPLFEMNFVQDTTMDFTPIEIPEDELSVIKESFALGDKIFNLQKFIESNDLFGKLAKAERKDRKKQLRSMRKYKSIVDKRINRFSF